MVLLASMSVVMMTMHGDDKHGDNNHGDDDGNQSFHHSDLGDIFLVPQN